MEEARMHRGKRVVDSLKCPLCELALNKKGGVKFHLRKTHKLTHEEVAPLMVQFSDVITTSELKGAASNEAKFVEKYGSRSYFASDDFKRKTGDTYEREYGKGVRNASQVPSILEKQQASIRKRNQELYGVDCSFSRPEVQDRVRRTLLERTGFDSPLKCPEVKERVKATNRKRYGSDWGLGSSEVQEKRMKTCQERYGGNSPYCDAKIVEQGMNTDRSNHGGLYHSQTVDHQKTMFTRKPFVFPSGRRVKVQGNEAIAIEILLKDHEEKDLLVTDQEIEARIGRIWYTTPDGEKHRYFPDILVLPDLVVEVKSQWTMTLNVERNELKRRACLDRGLRFEFMVID